MAAIAWSLHKVIEEPQRGVAIVCQGGLFDIGSPEWVDPGRFPGVDRQDPAPDAFPHLAAGTLNNLFETGDGTNRKRATAHCPVHQPFNGRWAAVLGRVVDARAGADALGQYGL